MIDTVISTLPMLSLEQRLINCFEEVAKEIGIHFPKEVEEIGFFIRSSEVTPTCRTNIRAAFIVGKLNNQCKGRSALLAEIMWLCVIVKDAYIKNSTMVAVLDYLDKAEQLLQLSKKVGLLVDLY